MKRKIISILLVVVTAFSYTYAAADGTDLNKELYEILDSLNRIDAIDEVAHNGLMMYPDKGWEGEHAFESLTFVPDMTIPENADYFCGEPFFLTGFVVDVKGYGIDFRLDDGRVVIISFDPYDFEKKEIVDMGNYPRKGKRCNIFCTFQSIGWELIGENTLHFIASATERARELCLRSKK